MPRRRAGSPKEGLDPQPVARAAGALGSGAGLDAVPLACRADRLGVRTPSLSYHVANLAGLHHELTPLARGEPTATLERAAAGRRDDAALVALANAHRAYARAHRGRSAATVDVPADDDPALIAASKRLVALATYALADGDAVHTVLGLRCLIHGFVTLEAAGGLGVPLDRDESFRRLLETFAAGLWR